MDVVLVFIVFRALLFGRVNQPFHKLLALALGAMFLSDFVYDLWYGATSTPPAMPWTPSSSSNTS